MRLLVEEYQYDATKVEDILKGIMDLRGIDGKISVNYVGYFYNPTLKDCVFILPKVVLDDKKKRDDEKGEEKKDLVFGLYDPHELINIDDWYKNKMKGSDDNEFQKSHDFIYELSVWIYRSLVVFRDNLKKEGKSSDIVLEQYVQQMGNGRTAKLHTFLDVLLALLRFNRENQSFFFFILRNMHSGFNKINWTRTISHSSAFIQDGAPIYLDPVNKKRQINFDEELIIIFFSILSYINERYGFPVNIDIKFPLIKGSKFQAYINGMGAVRLRQMKYKYFSDKALYLWELCYAFFDRCRDITVQTTYKEYLLVKSYHVVFESIIDELIGDKDIPDGLKEQDDGKRVDHMYTYQGLTTHETDKLIYYIGDSKYYKRGNEISKESVYKQFTYARNVIQWNMNLFMNEETNDKDKAWKNRVKELRDDVTEGYNVIPNFFISAKLNDELNCRDEVDKTDKHNTHFSNAHFKNRLFDRDTLLVCHYDVNFLYVVSLYARNNNLQKEEWKSKVREKFRSEIQSMLKEKYSFYAMQAHDDVDAHVYLKEHFQQTLGKIYTPFDNKEVFSLALDKTDPEGNNEELLTELRKHFYVESCELGNDPTATIGKVAKGTVRTGGQILVVRAGNDKQVKWIKDSQYYNLPLDKAKDIPSIFTVQTLLILCDQKKLLCHVPKTSNMRAVSSQQLKDEYKYYKEPSSKVGYLLIRLQEIEETDIELKNIVANNEAEKKRPYWWGWM